MVRVGTWIEAAFGNMRRKAAFGVVVLWLATSVPALALEQPGGAPIPSDMGCDSNSPTGLAATFACQCTAPGVCNIGDACPGDMDPSDCDDGQNATCETTIWHDWNDNGTDSPALFRPSNVTMYFRYTNSQGNADTWFVFGQPGWLPVAGNFD